MFGSFRFFRRLRRFIKLTLLLLFAGLLFSFFQNWHADRSTYTNDPITETKSVSAEITPTFSYTSYNPQPMRAMWLSQFDLSPILLENGTQRERSDYTARIKEVMAHVAHDGFNTVFVQIRPNGDSFYPSDLFPSSPYAVGEIGGSFLYDPFEILLEAAHHEGLSVHAWINPFRLFSETNRQRLSMDEPLRVLCEENSDKAVQIGQYWYLNPAYAENRNLIINGVCEILERYEVDGIHIDDYFYPTTDPSFDPEIYRRSGNGVSLGDFRRNAVNTLIRCLYKTVHDAKGGCIFGVSPSGNTQRNYETLYADVALWCERDGYLDYLCPQIYYGLEHETLPFEQICREFDKMVQAKGVRLCIGMTLEKAYRGFYGEKDPYAGDGENEWIKNRNILARCLAVAEQLEHADGIAFFSYQFFYSPENGSSVAETADERHAVSSFFRQKEGT